MVPVAHKDAQFIDLETFQGVQDLEHELRVDLFEIVDEHILHAFLFLGDQRLIPSEFQEIVLDVCVDDGDDFDDFVHDVVLDEDVASGFDEPGVGEDVFVLVDDGVVGVAFVLDLGEGGAEPFVGRVGD